MTKHRLRPALRHNALGLLRRGGGFDYYVDSVNGDDGNDGASPETALKTIGALPALQPGDRIGLARGSHWREQLTITVDNVTVEAYGTGDKPLLDCSDIVTGWAKTEGQTNIYEVQITPEWGDANELTAYEDDEYLQYVASTALCDSTPGSYTLSGTSGTVTLYIHPFDSTDPTTDGKRYEYAHRTHGISSYDATGVRVRGVAARRNLHNGGALRVGVNGRLDDCLVPQAGKYGILCRDGSVINNCTVHDTYTPLEAVTMGIHPFDPAPQGRGVTITGCTVAPSVARQRYGKNLSGITVHASVGTDMGSLTIRNCVLRDLTFALSNPRHTSTVVVQQCRFEGCQYLHVAPSDAPEGATVLIDDCDWVSDVFSQRAIDVQYAMAAITVRNYRATLLAAPSSGYVCVRAAAPVTVEDCTFTTEQGATNRIAVFCSGAGSNLTLRRNVFDGLTWALVYRFTAVPTYTSDYNIFAPNFVAAIGEDTYNNLADYQAATGQDANSTVGT